GEYRDVAVPPVRKLAAQPRAKFIGELREGLGIAVQTSIPVVLRLLATRLGFAEMLQRRLGYQEIRLQRPAQLLLGRLHVLDAQRRTVRLETVLLRRAIADMRAHQDQGRSRGLGH